MAVVMLRSKSNPKALLCSNDNMAIGVVSAVHAADKLGKVLASDYDNIDAIKAMLVDGRVITAADQHTDQQAVYGIETVLKALALKIPQAKSSGVVETPVSLITRS